MAFPLTLANILPSIDPARASRSPPELVRANPNQPAYPASIFQPTISTKCHVSSLKRNWCYRAHGSREVAGARLSLGPNVVHSPSASGPLHGPLACCYVLFLGGSLQGFHFIDPHAPSVSGDARCGGPVLQSTASNKCPRCFRALDYSGHCGRAFLFTPFAFMCGFSHWKESHMLRGNVKLMNSRCVSNAGIRNVHSHAGAAEHAVGSDDCVDLVAVYAEAGASEHVLDSGNLCLHRCGGCQRTRMPMRSDCPCGPHPVSRRSQISNIDIESRNSNLKSHISHLRSQISNLKFQISDFRSQISYLKYQCQASCFQAPLRSPTTDVIGSV